MGLIRANRILPTSTSPPTGPLVNPPAGGPTRGKHIRSAAQRDLALPGLIALRIESYGALRTWIAAPVSLIFLEPSFLERLFLKPLFLKQMAR